MDHDFAVLTPEKAVVGYRLAGLGSRVGAHLVDLVVSTVLVIAAVLGLSFLFGQLDSTIAVGMSTFLAFLLPLVYFVLLEGLWNGQTLGKRAAGIRVRMADGTPITFAAALSRNLLRPADMLPGTYLVGLLAMFLNPRAQRLGDLVADTVVCYERVADARFSIAPHSVGIHPLEGHVGELRGMTREEYVALRRLADRFPELSAPIQERLLKEVWEPVAERRKVEVLPEVHPVYLVEAVVMKYGRQHGLL